MLKKNIVLHIGYPKCASTSLQENLFMKHPDILDLNFKGRYKDDSKISHQLKSLKDNLVFSTDISFDKNKALNNLRNIYNYFKEDLSNKIPIISNEDITNPWFTDLGVKAKIIKEVFNNPKIIILIRNQKELLRSLYDMMPHPLGKFHTGYSYSFIEWLNTSLKFESRSFIGALDFYKVVKKYFCLFDKKNVKVFLFEEFVENQEQFIEKISKFIGIDYKKSISLINKSNVKNSFHTHKLGLIAKKYTNYYPLSKILEYIPSSIKKKVKIQIIKKLEPYKLLKDEKEIINSFFYSSNKSLEKLLKIDLKKFNYY